MRGGNSARQSVDHQQSVLPKLPVNAQVRAQSKQLSYNVPGFSAHRHNSCPDTTEATESRKLGAGVWVTPQSARRTSPQSVPSHVAGDLSDRGTPPDGNLSATSRPQHLGPMGSAASGASNLRAPAPRHGQQSQTSPAPRTPLSPVAPSVAKPTAPQGVGEIPPPPTPPQTGSSVGPVTQRKGRFMNNHRQSQYRASTEPPAPPTPSASNSNSMGCQLTGLLPWCHRCNNTFPEDKDAAKFCLLCGEARLERCHVADAFHKIVGNRAYLRKMDLRKFQRYCSDLLETLARDNAKGFRCITSCVQGAFNSVMEEQQKNGVTASQGISIFYFENFLARVARSLDLTMPSLLFGLLEQPETSWSTMDFGQANDLSTPSSRRNSTIEVMETPSTAKAGRSSFVDGCTKCGSKFISNAKFCCECGEKQPEPKKFDKGGFHFFKGTELSIASGRQPEVRINQKDFEEVVDLAKKHQMRIEDVRRVQREFHDLDKNHNGKLSLDELVEAVRRYCNLPDGEVPKHLLDKAWFRVGADTGVDLATDGVNFEQFLTWTNRVASTEEMLVSDPQERYLRRLAREHGLALTDIDDMKKLFDRFDTNKNGTICEHEFRTMMAIFLDGGNPEDLPEQTVHRLWNEIGDRQMGSITFERFLLWSSGNLAH